MKKRKSTIETKNMVQTAVWLPRNVHAQLKQAGGERGLGDEIRRRLHFDIEVGLLPRDATTEKLVTQIREAASVLSRDEAWHATRYTFDAFKAAIETLLLDLQPSSDAKPETKARFQAAYKSETPEAIGVVIAHAILFSYARERLGEASPKAD